MPVARAVRSPGLSAAPLPDWNVRLAARRDGSGVSGGRFDTVTHRPVDRLIERELARHNDLVVVGDAIAVRVERSVRIGFDNARLLEVVKVSYIDGCGDGQGAVGPEPRTSDRQDPVDTRVHFEPVRRNLWFALVLALIVAVLALVVTCGRGTR